MKAIGLPLAGAGSRSETEGGPGPWPRATPKLIEIFVHHTAYSQTMFPLLETLVAVYEVGQFTLAADELKVSQSTVS